MCSSRHLLLAVVALASCGVQNSGVTAPSADAAKLDTGGNADASAMTESPASPLAVNPRELPSVPGSGCADGTREGFRNAHDFPEIAGCAGGFGQPGVLVPTDASLYLPRVCHRIVGDTSDDPVGRDCSAADLCAQGWHVCSDGFDVAQHSATGGCEGCVSLGEPRFFLVALGAAVGQATDILDPSDAGADAESSLGICTHAGTATNDLHGCGGLGEAESAACAPLTRRMNFADCAQTLGVWWCGGEADRMREAAVVIKNGPTHGGVLCCKD